MSVGLFWYVSRSLLLRNRSLLTHGHTFPHVCWGGAGGTDVIRYELLCWIHGNYRHF